MPTILPTAPTAAPLGSATVSDGHVSAAAVALSARRCAAFAAAHRLATWVGAGKRVTTKQVLRPVDVPAAAQALGIDVPARLRSAADVVRLHRSWKVALSIGFLRIADGSARPGPALARWSDTVDDDTVRELWTTGLEAGFAAAVPVADEPGAAAFARFILAVVSDDLPTSFGDLWRGALGAIADEDTDSAYRFFSAWRRNGDPLGVAVDTLVEFGAAELGPTVTITTLGRWALRELRARAPKPITADLGVAEVITRLAQVEDGVWAAARPWLIGRNPRDAARELLAAAATATPAQRTAVVHLVVDLGPDAETAWEYAATVPNLAVHARASESGDADERDRAWLAVEYAAAALAQSGPDEALSCLEERVCGDGLDELLRAAECGGHPAIAELADALAAFLASGATPTSSRVIQLKISLNRMRPPVWRRVLLPATADLATLHQVIQVVMGWDGDHLHAFQVGPRTYGDTYYSPDVDDEEELRCSAAFGPRDAITYRYDFGANWTHTITCERVLDLVAGTTYPVCVAGRGEAPVEDWTDGPESRPFDPDEINRRLAAGA